MMKNKIYNILTASLVLLAASSCNENGWDDLKAGGNGELQLSSLEIQLNDKETVVTRSRAAAEVEDYLVTITDQNGKMMGNWQYGKMPEIVTLPAGTNYKVKVESHEIQLAEFDRPYYAGEKEFNIETSKITKVGEVEAKFASLRVSIKFDDELKKVLGSNTTVTVKGTNNSELVFTPNETRSGYFAIDGSTTFAAHFSGDIDGVKTENATTFQSVEAGQHHIITYNVKNGPEIPEQTGGIDKPGVSLDVNYDVANGIDHNTSVDEDLLDSSDRPGQEESSDPKDPENPDDNPENPGEDEDKAIVFEAKDSPNFQLNSVNYVTDKNKDSFGKVIVHIIAENEIKLFNVKIESDDQGFLDAINDVLQTEFELTEPGDIKDKLDDLSLTNGDEVKGAKEVDFEITDFIPLLAVFNGNHEFVLTITDNENKVGTKRLKFNINCNN